MADCDKENGSNGILAAAAGSKRDMVASENTAPKKYRADTAAATPQPHHPQPRIFGEIKGGDVPPDPTHFSSHPCRIGGGQRHPASSYGRRGDKSQLNTYWYYMQRQSNRNYAMRNFCLGGGGAWYSSFKHKLFISRCVNWHTPTNLEDHYQDEKIVDCCHLDLVAPNPVNNKSLLTDANLLAACERAGGGGPGVECLFLNLYQGSDDGLVRAIRATAPDLLCASLVSCRLSRNVLDALAACPNLKGLILADNDNEGKNGTSPADDAGMAKILRSCPRLTWLFVDQDFNDGAAYFGTQSWRALAEDECCPALEVLWVDSLCFPTNGRYGIALGDPEAIRAALKYNVARRETVKLCMVNPDHKLKTRFVLNPKKGAKKADRLEGDECKW